MSGLRGELQKATSTALTKCVTKALERSFFPIKKPRNFAPFFDLDSIFKTREMKKTLTQTRMRPIELESGTVFNRILNCLNDMLLQENFALFFGKQLDS